jgi:hypothetical protein
MVYCYQLFKEYFFNERRNEVYSIDGLLCFHMDMQYPLSGKYKFSLVI